MVRLHRRLRVFSSNALSMFIDFAVITILCGMVMFACLLGPSPSQLVCALAIRINCIKDRLGIVRYLGTHVWEA